MSFTPNTKLVKIDYTIYSNNRLDDALLCWSPALACEVFLDAHDINDNFNTVMTKEQPENYTGQNSHTKEWAILTNKNGNENQIFWTEADQFSMGDEYSDEDTGFSFIDNNGLDIDVEHITVDSCAITYDDGENSWEVGDITDFAEGKITLYSRVESSNPSDTDDDGDDVYITLPQEKFNDIRELFKAAGFTVKVKTIRH
jgi:hypothetical protein